MAAVTWPRHDPARRKLIKFTLAGCCLLLGFLAAFLLPGADGISNVPGAAPRAACTQDPVKLANAAGGRLTFFDCTRNTGARVCIATAAGVSKDITADVRALYRGQPAAAKPACVR